MKSSTLFLALMLSALEITVLSQTTLLDQQRIIVAPSAVMTWDDIVRIDAERVDWSKEQMVVHPPQYGPIAGRINSAGNASVKPKEDLLTSPAEALRVMIPTLDFDAVLDNGSDPPDTHGSVGPAHVMTMVNGTVRIQTKLGVAISIVSLYSFWSALPSGYPFDPRLHYDTIHGRWIACCAADRFSSSSRVFFAISSSSDPTGSWSFYSFIADSSGSWADFPILGFNTNWIAISASIVPGATAGPKLWVIDKSTALSGGPLTVTIFGPEVFTAGGTYYSFLYPCVTFGSEPTLYILDERAGGYPRPDGVRLARLSQITGTGSAPMWSAVPGSDSVGRGLFPTGRYNAGYFAPAAQLGTQAQIVTGGGIGNAIFRNGKIWYSRGSSMPDGDFGSVDREVVNWYQLNPTLMPRPVIQSGTLDGGPGIFYFYPSVAVNSRNDMCIGFSRSDSTIYVQAAYAGRLATDPFGTLRPIQTLKSGEGPYWKTSGGPYSRWGDYSNTCVDPLGDSTFWTIQEYAGVPVGSGDGSGRWATRWGKIEPTAGLPIKLASFSALPINQSAVMLEWTTISEINNYGFEMQRRQNLAHEFQTLPSSFIPGHGTTNVPQHYSFVDSSVQVGTWQYRLKQIDLDGTLHYTEPIQVNIVTSVKSKSIPTEISLEQNYPNPFNPSTVIKYGLPKGVHVTLSLFNTLGQRVQALVDEVQQAGYHEATLDGSSLASGVYLYRIEAGDVVQTRTLVLLR